MELLSRDDYDKFLAEYGIIFGRNGLPEYKSGIESDHHIWHYTQWDIKKQPQFISLLIDALAPWEWCLLAKRVDRNPSGWYFNEQTPFFRFDGNYDCPIMGTYCQVNPQSVDEDGEIDDCMFFDEFCVDQWARYDAVKSLVIPEDFNGALRLSSAQNILLIDIILITLYFGGPWDDLLIFPSHGRQIYIIDHHEMVINLFRDAKWGENVREIALQQGFT